MRAASLRHFQYTAHGCMDPPPRYDATRSTSFEERRRNTSFGWGMFLMILIAQFIAMSAAFGFTFLGTYAPQVVIGSGASPVLIMRGRNTASIGAITGAAIAGAGVGGAGTSGASVGVANIGAASVSLPCANFGAIEAAESNSAIMVERLSTSYPLASAHLRRLPRLFREPPTDPTGLPDYVNATLQPALALLDQFVAGLVAQSHSAPLRLIYLPNSDTLTSIFLSGKFTYESATQDPYTQTFFGGRSLTQRYPGQRFAIGGIGDARFDAPSYNLVRLVDINTELDPALMAHNLRDVFDVTPGNNEDVVLLVTQRHSTRAAYRRDALEAAMATAHYAPGQLQHVAVDYEGDGQSGHADTAVVGVRLADLLDPAQSQRRVLLVLNFGPSPAAQKALAIALSQQLLAHTNEPRLMVWALGFTPRSPTTTLPVPLSRGVVPILQGPTEDLAALGYPRARLPLTLSAPPPDLALLDAAKLASQCRTGIFPPVLVSGATATVATGTNTLVSPTLQHTTNVGARMVLDPDHVADGFADNGAWSHNDVLLVAEEH